MFKQVLGLLAGVAVLSTTVGVMTGVVRNGEMERPSYIPQGFSGLQAGDELVVYYIGASFCGHSTAEGFHEVIDQMKMDVARQAAEAARPFAAIGVAIDWSPRAGFRHLDEMGGWDEMTIGRNWKNSKIMEFVWQDSLATPSTPQVLVMRRRVSAPSMDDPDAPFTEAASELVLRKVGRMEIEEWVEERSPIDDPDGP